MSFMEKLKFSDLVYLFEKCSTATNSAAREKYMKKYLEKVLELQQKYKKQYPANDCNLYPLIRILLSSGENERSYGIQEKTLRKILLNSLKIAGNDAKRIEQCNENDIGDVVYETVRVRSSRDSKLTIQQVDHVLNQLCENQKQQFQQTQFEYLFLNGSASDLKWIVNIVLKSMKIKVGVSKILKTYHPLAPQLFSKINHLSKICEIIENGEVEEALKDIVKPFIPIRSMLSQKFSANMNNIIAQFEFYQEIKLDGERFQIHLDNGEYKYFSRNGYDFSENFNNILSPLIKFKPVVKSLILDGEMMIWNKTEKRFVTKGETELDVKKLKDLNYHLRPVYCSFDVLFLNGVSYIDQPFSRRCEILNSLYDDQVGVIIKTQPIRIRDVEHLVSLFNEAMKKEEEGIILKKSDSKYMPGEREKGGWYKVKADYFDGELVKEFDCVIIGGNFQNPHKRDFLQKYQVGAVDKTEYNTFRVYSIGEVSLGLSHDNRMKLNNKLSPHFINIRNNEKEIEFEKGHVYFGREKPHVFIPPHKSIVLQIRVSELAPSTSFYTKYSFRFPRISEIRYDKLWDESMTLMEFQDIFQNGNNKSDNRYDRRVKKVNQRNFHKDDIFSSSRNNRRQVLSSRSAAIALFCHDSQEDVEPIDNALEGKEFCVLTTSPSQPSIHDIKILLRTHGGTITEFPRKNKTFAIIASEIQRKVKNYINEKIYNVIKVEWVVQNLTLKNPLKVMPNLDPSHFHFINDEMRNKFSSRFDQFGDSYTEPFKSSEELKEIVSRMDIANETLNSQDYIEFESELFNEIDFRNPNIFRSFYASFYNYDNPNFLMKTAESIFKYRAGHVTSSFSSYIFVDKNVKCDDYNQEFDDRQFIDFRYILDSNDAGKLLDIQKYKV